jgi:hypothetical protein
LTPPLHREKNVDVQLVHLSTISWNFEHVRGFEHEKVGIVRRVEMSAYRYRNVVRA